MSYAVQISPAAERSIRKLEHQIQRRILKKIETLKFNPRPNGIEKLDGHEGEPIYRVRVGDYRIIYEIHDQKLIVLVLNVGDRKDVYRRLPS